MGQYITLSVLSISNDIPDTATFTISEPDTNAPCTPAECTKAQLVANQVVYVDSETASSLVITANSGPCTNISTDTVTWTVINSTPTPTPTPTSTPTPTPTVNTPTPTATPTHTPTPTPTVNTPTPTPTPTSTPTPTPTINTPTPTPTPTVTPPPVTDTPTPTPTSTPTPTPSANCYEYEVTNQSGTNVEYSYRDCDGVIQGQFTLTGFSTTPGFCARENSVTGGGSVNLLDTNCTGGDPVTPTPTSTPTPTPTPNYQSWIAERNDGGDVGYVQIQQGYSEGDEVFVTDTSFQCWTLGSLTTTAPTLNITGICQTPTPTGTPTPTPGLVCFGVDLEYNASSNDFDCLGGPTMYLDTNDLCTAVRISARTDCSNNAPAGWYSDGNWSRQWSGTSFTGACVLTNCP